MLKEPVYLQDFNWPDFRIRPKKIRPDDPAPFIMSEHLKRGLKAVRNSKNLIVYVFNNGQEWYIFETSNSEWSQPRDGELIGATSRGIKTTYGFKSDGDCIGEVLARKQIPLSLCSILSEGDPVAFNLFEHHPGVL